MEEREAKKKWCPVRFLAPPTEAVGVRGLKQGQEENCVASRCMAWRWVTVPDPANNVKGNGVCGLGGSAWQSP